jgi:2-hydroxychromene-2-carboxylate isomerase
LNTTPPTLYYDLGSPYAYLATERAAAVLGVEPRLQPVLVGGIFALRGHGSWGETAERGRGIAEIEERAGRYGLPPLRWPAGWPNNTLQAMRAATVAQAEGAGREFARAGFRRAFAEGADLSDPEQIAAVAVEAGLDADELAAATGRQETKDALRRASDDAWERGVAGVPSLELGERIFFGDDRLEQAAELLRSGVPERQEEEATQEDRSDEPGSR